MTDVTDTDLARAALADPPESEADRGDEAAERAPADGPDGVAGVASANPAELGGDPEDGSDDGLDDPADRALSGAALLVEEGDIAADYLERLLDIVDYDGDIDLDVENDRAVVAVVGTGLQALVGPHGETLDALQELTRLAVQQKTGIRSRLMLDVSGHRQRRRAELGALATETARRVLDTGEPVRLDPMNPFERKVVHDVVSAVDGVRSESEGEEPQRRVVVLTDQ